MGVWYTPGSNTYVHSFPFSGGELGQREHQVRTSNRRFKEEEFLIPGKYTKGRTAVRLKIEFKPEGRELYPGHPFPKETAWSELSYKVYSYVMPKFSIKGM